MMVITDRWVLERRGPKARLDPMRAYAAVYEEELDATGRFAPTAVVFLTNRDCPFRCVMCDLWRHTLDETVPPGAIAAQIRRALTELPAARQIKLYNAGSFFDPAAIPPDQDDEIADAVARFDRVIVEAHPGFLTGAYAERCLRFRDRLRGFRLHPEGPRLEVAIGLETAHPATLARLNKRMTIESFRRAASFLTGNDIDLRVFILLNPPFLRGAEAVEWACRSIDVAADCGATACSVIPTRSGNGAMEALGAEVDPPRLPALEHVIEYGISLQRLRVFSDLWDIERFFDCRCAPERKTRLAEMNRTQRATAAIMCDCAGTDLSSSAPSRLRGPSSGPTP
jgi:archaeosine synthase beta-subunit